MTLATRYGEMVEGILCEHVPTATTHSAITSSVYSFATIPHTEQRPSWGFTRMEEGLLLSYMLERVLPLTVESTRCLRLPEVELALLHITPTDFFELLARKSSEVTPPPAVLVCSMTSGFGLSVGCFGRRASARPSGEVELNDSISSGTGVREEPSIWTADDTFPDPALSMLIDGVSNVGVCG